MEIMMDWLFENACGEDCIPGAYYHSHIETWEIIDPVALREYIQNND
jgi:hypothetical protein